MPDALLKNPPATTAGAMPSSASRLWNRPFSSAISPLEHYPMLPGQALLFLSVVLAALVLLAPTARAASSPWLESDAVSARLISAAEATGDAEEILAGLHVRLAEGWKTYWRSPGDAGIAPTVDWGRSDNVASVDFQWPAPHRFSLFGIETFGYEREVVFSIGCAA